MKKQKNERSKSKNIKPKKIKKKRPRTKKQKKELRKKIALLLFSIAVVCAIGIGIYQAAFLKTRYGRQPGKGGNGGKIPRPELDVEFLTINEYSRPGIALEQVKGVVIHYTANPGTSARNNRDYFEGLKDSHITKASSHFVVGLEGEIVQCIPCSEISYASNSRNIDTVSIECCIPDDTGKFNTATYNAVVHLTAWLAERYQLSKEDVIRHYDVTGKNCPKYYVEHPRAWEQLRTDVQAYMKRFGV